MRVRRIWVITDFQEGSPYIAEMKGVIYKINPEACVVDITHSIPPQNVEVGAFVLESALNYIPEGDIILGVVDPGVGTGRKPILVVGDRHVMVGPDNGLFSFVKGLKKVYEIDAGKVERIVGEVSATFHGRDIFAPVAALISMGVKPEGLGRPLTKMARLPRVGPRVDGGRIRAKVIYVDPFGNVVTNVPSKTARKLFKVGSRVALRVGGKPVSTVFARTYGDVPPGETLLLVNSFGLLELAVNRGSAARKYGVKVGDDVLIALQNS